MDDDSGVPAAVSVRDRDVDRAWVRIEDLVHRCRRPMAEDRVGATCERRRHFWAMRERDRAEAIHAPVQAHQIAALETSLHLPRRDPRPVHLRERHHTALAHRQLPNRTETTHTVG